MSKTYVNLEFKWGPSKFYERSKVAKEGFDAIPYVDKKTNEAKTTYHRLIDSVEGTISSVAVQETSFGRYLKVNLQTGKDEITSISVGLDDKYGYSREAMAFISSLRGYKLGEEVSINPVVSKYTKKTGKEGMNVAFYINYKNIQGDNGKSASTGYIDSKKITAVVEEEKLGKKTFNYDARMQFYYDTLETIKANFSEYWDKIKADAAAKKSNDNTGTTPDSNNTKQESPVNAEPFDDDDLPF